MLPEVSSTKTVWCRSLEDLDNVVQEVVEFARDCTVWCLSGELGSGKTTFVQRLGKLKGVMDTVSSPSFSIVNEYRTTRGEPIYHFDLFRVKDLQEALAFGIIEYLDSGFLCLIEWPELIEPLLPEKTMILSIESKPDRSRIFHLRRND